MRGSPWAATALASVLCLGIVPAQGAAGASVAPPPVPQPRVAPPPCVPTVSSAGTDAVLTFDDTVAGGCTWTVPAGVTSVRVLVVAGGGGGGAGGNGGGGAGGMQEVLSYVVSPGAAVSVVVGAGGAGATGWDDTTMSRPGGDSRFDLVVSSGGGGGRGWSGNPDCLPAGNGGSGGGATGYGYTPGQPQYCYPGTGAAKSWADAIDDTQGSRGSNLGLGGAAGGGGGAGSKPNSVTHPGEGMDGGPGRLSSITGEDTYYSGGGGGGGGWDGGWGNGTTPRNAGGIGGGGAGGLKVGPTAPLPGQDGKGGGGGGAGATSLLPGARGGSGVVIVRYARQAQSIVVAATPNPVRINRQATLSASGFLGTGAITYAVATGGDKCSISGSTLSALGEGACTVTATIAQDDLYASATSAPLSVTVLPRVSQTIRAIATPSSLTVPGTVALTADSYQGTGAITYSLVSGTVCSLTGAVLTVSNAGTCQVQASIAQDDTYASAISTPVAVAGASPPPPPPPPIPPSVPLSVEAQPGPRSATVRWLPPADPGSPPVSAYWVMASPGGERVCNVRPVTGPWQTCTVSSLTPGQRYEFWVQAVNSAGQSPNSERAGAVPLGPPGPPRPSVQVVDEVLSVTWEPPVNDGGLPLSSYRIEQRSPGGEWIKINEVAGTRRSTLVTDLRSGTTYEFRVTAWNSAGEGTPSEPVTGSVTLEPVTVSLPGAVPIQSFTPLGELPGKAELRVQVSTPQSRYVCSVVESPTLDPFPALFPFPAPAGRVPNVVAFLRPGTCTLQIWRSSASVVYTLVGTVATKVAADTALPPGVMAMDVIRLTYPADSQFDQLPKDRDDAYQAWVRGYRQPWPNWTLPRQVYGGPFVFCPSMIFRPAGGWHDHTTTTDREIRRAARRCSSVAWPVSTLPSAPGRSGSVPTSPGTNPLEFEVAMMPVNLLPAAPRNVEVRPGTFEATVTWDPPSTTARTPVTGYAAWYRPAGETKWSSVDVDAAKRTARISFESRAWKDVPVGTDIEVRVAATNDVGIGASATTDFRLDYRLPEFTNVPDVVPPQSWVPLFERRGNPDVSLQTRGSGCSITRARYLLFTGPGGCEVIYRIDDHLGNYVRWVTAFKMKVEEGAERASGVRPLEMVNITFVDKEARPDARSRERLQDLVGSDIEAVHIYEMVPGKVPRPLVSQRESEVRKALRAWSDRSAYVSRSPIQQSGLPEGDGDLMRIGFIRRR